MNRMELQLLSFFRHKIWINDARENSLIITDSLSKNKCHWGISNIHKQRKKHTNLVIIGTEKKLIFDVEDSLQVKNLIDID